MLLHFQQHQLSYYWARLRAHINCSVQLELGGLDVIISMKYVTFNQA